MSRFRQILEAILPRAFTFFIPCFMIYCNSGNTSKCTIPQSMYSYYYLALQYAVSTITNIITYIISKDGVTAPHLIPVKFVATHPSDDWRNFPRRVIFLP